MAVDFWALVQAYIDDTGATEAAVQRKAGLNKGTFTAWRARGIPTLPDAEVIERLAGALRADFDTVVNAILETGGYTAAARRNPKRPPSGPRVQGPD